uniref:Ubiquitin conjugating enzyme E2 W n=1 Tax=Laticauda laticaudata TaxID=8630 RepID=A0A8C5WWV0_LATLA
MNDLEYFFTLFCHLAAIFGNDLLVVYLISFDCQYLFFHFFLNLLSISKRKDDNLRMIQEAVKKIPVHSYPLWIVDMEGASGTLYEGEKFQLLFKFSSRYPFDSPQVVFTGENIPVHPHVYSNGHICLSILTEDWSPALSVQSVCLSIISMLSSCKEKV